ncbi:hypothetical protein KVT40_005557 [Elsinoe batatas]|uniref:Uncharacterized protein n=1 Tax=Elsinoe batatas TaxID=2601811 RepID=A0A8K0PFI9_9PEZI|nr:hypothetical protein KVT40_005557 [Elsinoe batatas]
MIHCGPHNTSASRFFQPPHSANLSLELTLSLHMSVITANFTNHPRTLKSSTTLRPTQICKAFSRLTGPDPWFCSCLFKLWYSIWKVRKYTALEKLADKVQVIREKSIIRSLSTKNVRKPKRQRSSRERMQEKDSTQVPFGIRALEEGTRLDEVWDSRPSSREVSHSDFAAYRLSNASTTDLRHGRSIPMARRESSGLTSETASTGDISSLQLTPMHDDAQGQPSPPLPNANGRSKYPPHSFAKYEGVSGYRTKNSFGPRLNTRLHPTDGPQPSPSAHSFTSVYSQATSVSDDASPGADQLRSDFRTTRHIAGSAPASLRSVSADSNVAMQQRRLSQVAETGQLLPRHRSERLDLDPASELAVLETTPSDRLSFEMDLEGADSDAKHFSTPSIRVTANTPGLDGTSPTSSTMQRGRRLRKRSITPPSTPVSASFSVSSRRSSEILRRVNSGFAVLRPGSLEVKLATPQSGTTSRIRSSSTESGGSVGSRRGRRLQKRMSAERSEKRGNSHE